MREERLNEWCYFGTRCARSYALPALPSNSSVIDPSRLAPANQADQGAQLQRAVMGRAKLSLFQLSPQALTVVLMFDMDVVLLTSHSPQNASSRETCGSCFRVHRRRSEWEKSHTYISWSAGYVVRLMQAQLAIESCASVYQSKSWLLRDRLCRVHGPKCPYDNSTSHFRKRKSSCVGICCPDITFEWTV